MAASIILNFGEYVFLGGLLLPIKNLTFVGLSGRLRVVYSWPLLCWSNFRCKSANSKSKNGSKFWCFWEWIPLELKLKALNPEKARVRNRTCRWSYWTCESVHNCEMRKRKKTLTILKTENKSHKTVKFHHCVAAHPVNRSQPNLVCL